MKEPALYRTPKAPGYLGRYNWRSTLTGAFILLIANSTATQFIAKQFAYQPALGTAILSFKTGKAYQPFAWIAWGWKNCTSHDDRVRHPLMEGEMIALVGSFLAVLISVASTSRWVRKLSEGSDDLHGSARLATRDDIEQIGLLDAAQGVYIGGWFDEQTSHLHYLRHNGPEHILAFAPTRSGKGVSLVIPTLLAWEESAVVYDIKGENWAKTSGFRQQQGHICLKFSPVETNSGSRFNPLAEIRIYTLRDVSDAQNIAEIIVRTGEDSPQERYWQDAAVSVTTGLIIHVCYEAGLDGRRACLADLSHTFTRPGQSFRDTLKEILNYQHDPDLAQDWRMPDGTRTPTHPAVKEKAQEMLDKEDKDFSGVLSTAKTALALFSDPLVVRNTSSSDFTVQDLVNHEHPVSLYLVVPPSDKERLRPLIRLMFTIIVNRLTEKMDFQGAEQRKNKHRLLFLIDEFPSLKRMAIFADALSYMAGYGLKAYLITQDVRQIVDAYGPNESIVSNCGVRVAFAANQQETLELLSKMTGTRTVSKATYSFSGSRLSPVLNQMNGTVDYIERPLMTPDEISRLRPPQKEGDGLAERILMPGQMLIFVSGQFPILGTQMLYFFDPFLSRRAALPPPTTFLSLTDGEPKPQPSLDRARLSKPEAAPLTPMTKGFANRSSHQPNKNESLEAISACLKTGSK